MSDNVGEQRSAASILEEIFLQESINQARNTLFALQAKKAGSVTLATRYQALSVAQGVRARKALLRLRGSVGGVEENHGAAVAELERLSQAYPQMLAQAKELENSGLAAFLDQLSKTTRNHLQLGKRPDQEGESVDYHVCRVCGFIASDRLPERCPVCQALQTKFQTVSGETRS